MNDQAIGAPLRRRIARYPNRPPRDDMLRDLERGWREVTLQRFRLEFRSSRQGKNCFILERAVTVVDAFRLLHWNDDEYGVAIMDTWMKVGSGGASVGVRSLMRIGSHALGRWYTRSPEESGYTAPRVGVAAGAKSK